MLCNISVGQNSSEVLQFQDSECQRHTLFLTHPLDPMFQGHIEDLRLVNERVKKSEKTLFYQEANQSLNNSLQ